MTIKAVTMIIKMRIGSVSLLLRFWSAARPDVREIDIIIVMYIEECNRQYTYKTNGNHGSM